MTKGISNQSVQIVQVHRHEEKGSNYKIFYTVDNVFPKLTNSDIYKLGNELDISDSEFHESHWAVKEADLFQSLYRSFLTEGDVYKALKTEAFRMSEEIVDPCRVSIMMPFDKNFDKVYEIMKNILEKEGYHFCRADDFSSSPGVMQNVVDLICTSKVIISDLTDRNANVFYETGIVHALGKETILITQDDINFIPADLRSLITIEYKNDDKDIAEMAKKILKQLSQKAPIPSTPIDRIIIASRTIDKNHNSWEIYENGIGEWGWRCTKPNGQIMNESSKMYNDQLTCVSDATINGMPPS